MEKLCPSMWPQFYFALTYAMLNTFDIAMHPEEEWKPCHIWHENQNATTGPTPRHSQGVRFAQLIVWHLKLVRNINWMLCLTQKDLNHPGVSGPVHSCLRSSTVSPKDTHPTSAAITQAALLGTIHLKAWKTPRLDGQWWTPRLHTLTRKMPYVGPLGYRLLVFSTIKNS